MVEKLGKICVLARGDGVIGVLNIDLKRDTPKSKASVKMKQSRSISKGGASSVDIQKQDENDREVHIDYSMGGHCAAVSSVTFSMFGEKGKFIISSGNDRCIKIWDWSKLFHTVQTNVADDNLCSNISLSKKKTWLSATHPK